VPKVDDDGNFKGSFIMYMSQAFYHRPVKLMNELALQCNDDDVFHVKEERYVLQPKNRYIEGQWVLITQNE
jgi:hypothetical protein